MNRHEFQDAARRFRSGKISLAEFTDQVYPPPARQENLPGSLPSLPVRKPDSHKGNYGHVVVVAGSRGMAGAAALAGMAALRTGSGRVTIATARSIQATVASFHPAIMTVGLEEDAGGRIFAESWEELRSRLPDADCLVVGPGLGNSPELSQLATDIFLKAPHPAVLDADALNNIEWQRSPLQAAGPRILTPHPGELQRMAKTRLANREEQENVAVQIANRTGSVIILKGNRSLITDGERRVVNATGNPGMATAGTGDVLAGIVASLAGQGLSAWDAAVLGCHLHGAAGDLAAARVGMYGMTATDVLEMIPETEKQLAASR